MGSSGLVDHVHDVTHGRCRLMDRGRDLPRLQDRCIGGIEQPLPVWGREQLGWPRVHGPADEDVHAGTSDGGVLLLWN